MNDIAVYKIVEDNIEAALQYLIQQAREELAEQGHKLTGRLSNSFETAIEGLATDCVTAKILQEDYALVLDKGIKRSRVPFSRRSGRGGKSKYIEGLIDFFRKRGKSLKDAKSFAFATAMKAKYRTGHPTRPYYQGRSYSRNGRRTGWTKQAYSQRNLQEFEKILRFADFAEELVIDIVQEINRAA